MIPHRFTRQRGDRPVNARRVNQTLDDVRRLAISQPGPGMGGMGTPGGLLSFVNSTDLLLATSTDAIAGRTSATNPNLTSGTANPTAISIDDSGNATLSTDTSTELPVYNLSVQSIPANSLILAIRLWGQWCIIWADCPQTGG